MRIGLDILTGYRNNSLQIARTLPLPLQISQTPIIAALARNLQASFQHPYTVPFTVQYNMQLGDPEAANWYLNTTPYNHV